MHSNRYIFIYASVMVVLVAALLSAAAIVLQPFQDLNVRVEKMQQILLSANIESTPETAINLYDKHIISELVVNMNGDVISIYESGKLVTGEQRGFEVNLKAELKKLDEFRAGNKNANPVFPLFISEKDGEKLYIIPMYGKGLWGPIWGNVALRSDFNTIAGVVFDHKGETPGLGAEISNKEFQLPFAGKNILNEKGEFVSIQVVKGGVSNSSINPSHGVDAISGGTITSDGVSEMIENCLSVYLPYFKSMLTTSIVQTDSLIVN
jgi:Na+-transporting NADH:ubiquinone oxidoreductase subunit C